MAEENIIQQFRLKITEEIKNLFIKGIRWNDLMKK